MDSDLNVDSVVPGRTQGASKAEGHASGPMSENFVPLTLVVEAAADLGLLVGEEGTIDVADILGPMTGLDMTKYTTELDVNLYGYRLVRKP